VYNEHLPVWFPRLPLLLASCTLSTTSLLAQSSSKRCLSRSASYLALSPPELYCSTYHPLNPAAGFPRLNSRFVSTCLMMFFFSFCETSICPAEGSITPIIFFLDTRVACGRGNIREYVVGVFCTYIPEDLARPLLVLLHKYISSVSMWNIYLSFFQFITR